MPWSSRASRPPNRKYRISSAPRTRTVNSSAAIASMVPPLQSPAVSDPKERFAGAAAGGCRLLLFGGVLAAEPGQLMLEIAGAIGRGDTCRARELYGRLFAALAEETELGTRPPGD